MILKSFFSFYFKNYFSFDLAFDCGLIVLSMNLSCLELGLFLGSRS